MRGVAGSFSASAGYETAATETSRPISGDAGIFQRNDASSGQKAAAQSDCLAGS